MRGVPGRIVSALGNVGGLLYNAGKAILQGFLNGLRSIWDNITGFIGSIANWIRDHKGPLSFAELGDGRVLDAGDPSGHPSGQAGDGGESGDDAAGDAAYPGDDGIPGGRHPGPDPCPHAAEEADQRREAATDEAENLRHTGPDDAGYLAPPASLVCLVLIRPIFSAWVRIVASSSSTP